MWKDIARNYSICSPPEQKGSFDLCLKVWPGKLFAAPASGYFACLPLRAPTLAASSAYLARAVSHPDHTAGGVMSPYLAEQMPLGWSVDFDLSKARQFTAPFEGADAAGRNLLLVAFGIGIADLVYTARRAADAGQNVSLVYATRCAADAVLVPEMIELAHKYAPQVVSGASDGSPAEGSQAEQESSHGTLKLLSAPVSPAPAKRGSITTYILLSREDPSPVFLAGLPPGIIVKHARVDDESLAEVTNGWDRDMSTVHAVGGKVQKKSTMRSLEDLGFTHKLLPKINNVSRYF